VVAVATNSEGMSWLCRSIKGLSQRLWAKNILPLATPCWGLSPVETGTGPCRHRKTHCQEVGHLQELATLLLRLWNDSGEVPRREHVCATKPWRTVQQTIRHLQPGHSTTPMVPSSRMEEWSVKSL